MSAPSDLAASLRKAARDLERMDKPSAEIGAATVQMTRRLVPVRSGRLRSSVTFRVGQEKGAASVVTISAGGSRAVYARVIHYGWPARNIAAQPYLDGAVARVAQRGIIGQAYADQVDRIMEGL